MKNETEKTNNSGKILNALLLTLKFVSKTLSISAKFTKIALAGVSLAAYTYMYSWEFALILMFQLLIHEYGHIWAMKRVGIKTKGIYFIPFIGGAAVASEDFKSRKDEVFVALMGPVFGFGCALVMFIIYVITDIPMYAAGASWMAMINLFNLLPINPLDGGRVFKSIAFSLHTWVGYVFMGLGILGAIYLALIAHIWLFIIVVLLSSLELALEIYFNERREKQINEFNRVVIQNNFDKLEFRKRVEELKQKYIKADLPVSEELLQLEEQSKEFVLDELKPSELKPKMSLLQVLITVVQYFTLAIILFMFMYWTSNVPGAKMAMEILQ